MKKIILFFLLLMTLTVNSQVPCPNDNDFWLNLTPTGPGDTQSSFCTFAGDYNTFNAITGVDYTINVCGGTYNSAITMYTNAGVLLYSQNNTAGNGCETFTWTSTFTGVVRLLVDIADCNTNSTCTQVDITQVNGGGVPTGNTDCATPTQICNDAFFTGNSNGFGTQNLNVGNQGCLSTEHQSSWYIFQVASSGTLALTITTAVDYDFAIWGPGTGCGALGIPIRCSWSAEDGNTGLGNGATDNSEDDYGNGWVAPLNVLVGQTYIMLIDNFTANSTAFTLDWTMTAGASLVCTPLPIELLSFTAKNINDKNVINWETASERDNDYFTIERSIDGYNWSVLSIIDGAGTTKITTKYEYIDYDYTNVVNYYRLKQTDFNGSSEYFNIKAINNKLNQKTIDKIYNIIYR